VVEPARSSTSLSLLRESETAEYFLDEDVKDFFKRAITEMAEKRKNPNISRTGAKAVREDMLSYLEQYGEIKTANIWVRGLNVYQIDELKVRIRQELEKEYIRGVVEIHLSDRQINSPHLQYVGTRAEKVEEILSKLAVDMGFELSAESAKSKNSIPAFEKYKEKDKGEEMKKVIKILLLLLVLVTSGCIVLYIAMSSAPSTATTAHSNNLTLETPEQIEERKEVISIIEKFKNGKNGHFRDYSWKKHKNGWTIRVYYKKGEILLLETDNNGNILKSTPVDYYKYGKRY